MLLSLQTKLQCPKKGYYLQCVQAITDTTVNTVTCKVFIDTTQTFDNAMHKQVEANCVSSTTKQMVACLVST